MFLEQRVFQIMLFSNKSKDLGLVWMFGIQQKKPCPKGGNVGESDKKGSQRVEEAVWTAGQNSKNSAQLEKQAEHNP